MDQPDDVPKAHLYLSVLGGERKQIPIYSQPYTIGRAKTCDFSIPNKIVSGQHCKLYHDETFDSFYLEDTSTNGMLINKKVRTTKGQKVQLKDNDEVYLVYRKQSPSQTDVISFRYERVSKAEETNKEAEVITNNNDEEDLTQEYFSPLDGKTQPQDEEKKRKRDEDGEINSSQKSKRQHLTPTGDSSGIPAVVSSSSAATCTNTADSNADVLPPAVPSQELSERAGQGSKDESAVKEVPTGKGEVVTAGTGQGDLPNKEDGGKVDGGPSNKKAEEEDSQDEMMETLICSICQDILHDCISLQPCLHSFCAACYSQWMAKSGRCPTCRKGVKRISKNHIVNNLVEAYLKTHPEKRRSKEEIDEMNASNKITSDMMLNPKHSDEDYSEGSDVDDLDSSAEMDDGSFRMDYPLPFLGLMRNVFAPPPPLPVMTCRQCPSYRPPPNAASSTSIPGSSSTTPGASTSGTTQRLPVAPPFVCPPGASHVMCKCCQQRFPDRRREPLQANLPPVRCVMCQMFYCHMYWGCTSTRNGGCLGCLNKLKDLNFGDKCTDLLILGNTQESHIFKKYLQQNNLTWRDVLSECLNKLESGEFWSVHASPNNITKDSVVCYPCGLKVFKDLALKYREKIPREQLPAEAAGRPDCHWGRNCRTQYNKPSHAARFNHVCDQTRFT